MKASAFAAKEFGMIVRIPVTRFYEVQINDRHALPTCCTPHALRQVAERLSVEQIEGEGCLVDTRAGEVQLVSNDFFDELPCTD
jgi:hypothetical protein